MQTNTLAKNSLFLILINLFEKFSGFIVTILIARLLGSYNYGIFTAVFAFSSLFVSFFELGFPLIIPRFISQKEHSENIVISSGLTLIAFAYPLTLIFSLFYLTFFKWGIETIPLAMAFLALINQASLGGAKLFRAIYLGKEKVKYDVFFTFFAKLLLILLIAILFFIPASLSYVFYSYILSNLCYLMFLILFLKKLNITFKFTWDKDFNKTILKHSLPLILVFIFYNIYVQIDALIVLNQLGEIQTGLYGAAKRLYQACIFVPYGLQMAFYPLVCKEIKLAPENLKEPLELLLKSMLSLAIPLAFFMIFFADDIISLTLGYKFKDASIYLIHFSIPLIVISFSTIFQQIIYTLNKLKFMTIIFAIALAINIPLTYLLVIFYGAKGSCWALAITELFNLISWILCTRSYCKSSFNRKLFSPITALLILFVIIFLFKNFLPSFWGLFASIAIALPVYLLSLEKTGVLPAFSSITKLFKNK